MKDGTTYYVRVVVRDNAGNEGKSAADNANGATATTPSANTNPWFTTQAYASSRSTNSMTISAIATDNEQTSLTYTLYWNGSSSATQTKTANKGTTVTFNAITGLSEYTTYSWRVVASDGAGGTDTSNGSQKTTCSGRTKTCVGGSSEICGKCDGWGFYSDRWGSISTAYITLDTNSRHWCDLCNSTSGTTYIPNIRCTTSIRQHILPGKLFDLFGLRWQVPEFVNSTLYV